MSFTLNQYAIQSGEAVFYDPKLRRVMETYMGWLRAHPDTRTQPVDAHMAYKYEGDFYGLLSVMDIAPEYHWVVLRVNGLTNPLYFPTEIGQILIPDSGVLRRIVQRFRAQNKKRST